MQTLPRISRTCMRMAVSLAAGAMMLSLGGCSLPRLQGRAEAERQADPCEQALTAVSSTPLNDTTIPLLVRYLALKQAPDHWIDVAASCSSRFAEGAMKSAQTQQQTAKLASKFKDAAPSTTAARLDAVDTLDVDGATLAKLALEEDKAGFAVEVLAARGTTGATLAVSDNHKTCAQQLMSLAQGADDLREKTYSIDHLDEANITDQASGRSVPVLAAIEMDCARNEIAALHDATGSADSLKALATLIAQHAYTAFQLGYPYDDAALFS